MSREIRRLHRKPTQFTNFSGDQTNELSESTENSTQDNSTQPIRRRRRRRRDSQNLSSASDQPIDMALLQNYEEGKIESPQQDIKQDSDNISSQPKLNISFSPSNEQSINSIRAEILEDRHHSDLIESKYSNDTHDWGQDSYDYSEEYSHFLGLYE